MVDFIEEALKHRLNGDNSLYDKAWRDPKKIENYLNNDRIFLASGNHPD